MRVETQPRCDAAQAETGGSDAAELSVLCLKEESYQYLYAVCTVYNSKFPVTVAISQKLGNPQVSRLMFHKPLASGQKSNDLFRFAACLPVPG